MALKGYKSLLSPILPPACRFTPLAPNMPLKPSANMELFADLHWPPGGYYAAIRLPKAGMTRSSNQPETGQIIIFPIPGSGGNV
jgi:hypothetical protein